MKLENKGKIKLSYIMVFAICGRFIFNAVKLFKINENGYALIYLLLAAVLFITGIIFLKKVKKTLLLLALMVYPFSVTSVAAQKPNIKTKSNVELVSQTDTLRFRGKEYMDTIYLGTAKTAFVDVKGFEFISGDLGSGINGVVKLAVQENSHILKLHATRSFSETNLFLISEDTAIQFLIKFHQNPPKNYYSYMLPALQTSFRRQMDSLSKLANIKVAHKVDTVLMVNENNHSLTQKADASRSAADSMYFRIAKGQKPVVNRGDINKGITIELRKMVVMNKNLYFVLSIKNETQRGDIQLRKVDVELQHTRDGSKIILDGLIEDLAYNVINPKSRLEFCVRIPDIQTQNGDKIKFTCRPVADNGLPDFVFDVTNRDLNLKQYINPKSYETKNK